MPLNGSELISQPWHTIFSPFTELFGTGFYLIPLSFLAVALYVKTHDYTVVSMFILASGSLFSTGGIFIGMGGMAFAYLLFAALGFIGLILSLILR